MDLKRWSTRSRLRVGRCEFSARLFKHKALMSTMLGVRYNAPDGRRVAGKLVRDHDTCFGALLTFEYLTEEMTGVPRQVVLHTV